MKSPLEDQGIQDCWNHIGVYGDSTCPELLKYHHCRNCSVYLQAGRALLEREPPSGYQSEWTRLLAQEKTATERGSLSVVLFRIGTHWLALPTRTFKEVSELSSIHSIPHRSNEVLLGFVQVGGELHLCVAMDQVLGLQSEALPGGKHGRAFRRLIVAELQGHRWVWSADEVFGVVRFDPDSQLPETGSMPTLAGGRFLWGEEEVFYLDEETVSTMLLRSLS